MSITSYSDVDPHQSQWPTAQQCLLSPLLLFNLNPKLIPNFKQKKHKKGHDVCVFLVRMFTEKVISPANVGKKTAKIINGLLPHHPMSPILKNMLRKKTSLKPFCALAKSMSSLAEQEHWTIAKVKRLVNFSSLKLHLLKTKVPFINLSSKYNPYVVDKQAAQFISVYCWLIVPKFTVKLDSCTEKNNGKLKWKKFICCLLTIHPLLLNILYWSFYQQYVNRLLTLCFYY